MSKYIIELNDDVQIVHKVRVTSNGNAFSIGIYKDDLEELTADYINEHYGDLQDTAYQKGYDAGIIASSFVDKSDEAYQRGFEDGKKSTLADVSNAEYKHGLEDAWEAARKVGHCKLWDDYTKDTGKPSVCAVAVLDHYTAYEAIAKLKAYDEKQKADGEIKVGDEVISLKKNGEVFEEMPPWIVTYEAKYSYQGFDACGMFHKNPKDSVRKTGRHFDIQKILEEMRE